MPIPPFDGIFNVLPPHLGDPRQISDLSPYRCTVTELCDRFGTSPGRKRILEGFLALRDELFALGIQGFQWLDGSFLEDIETQEGRGPKDIDVVSFVSRPADANALFTVLSAKPNLNSRAQVKGTYHVDHFWVPLGNNPILLVSLVRYWYGLFSHRRDRAWKGMLVVNLADQSDDATARIVLESKP